MPGRTRDHPRLGVAGPGPALRLGGGEARGGGLILGGTGGSRNRTGTATGPTPAASMEPVFEAELRVTSYRCLN